METTFRIEFLDHVALRVKDLKTSSRWYQKVLGLKEHTLPEWGEFPVYLLAGKSGIALFPAVLSDQPNDPKSKNVRLDHFAFQVTRKNFEKALNRYAQLNLDFSIQDHQYFESLYTKDPDGHTVELTTLKVNEDEFYR